MNNVKLSIEVVTPTTAKEWLDKFNRHNRRVNQRAVRRYAAAMAAGKWPLNGDTIVFASTGRLLQGQHRLSACVESGASFTTVVVRGVEENVFATYDIGRVRKAVDVLMGEPNPAVLGAVLTLVWKEENGYLDSQIEYPDNPAKMEVKQRHPELREAVEFGLTMKEIMPPSRAAFLYWMGRKVNTVATQRFMDQLLSGADLAGSSPVFAYREYLLKRAAKDPQRNTNKAVALGIKALEAYFSGREVKILKMNKREEFPKLSIPPMGSHGGNHTQAS